SHGLLRVWIGSLVADSFMRVFIVFCVAHRSALKRDAVSVVNEPVEDAVGHSGITDLVVPLSDGNLAGENRGTRGITVITDFQEVTALTVSQRSHGPIIDKQDVDTSNTVQEPAKAAISTGDSEITKQTRGADVKGSESLADRFVSQSTGNETLTDAARAGDDEVLVATDPNRNRTESGSVGGRDGGDDDSRCPRRRHRF